MKDNKTNIHTPLSIVLQFDESKELENLYKSKDFNKLIYEETEKTLDFIIKNKPEKIDLFKLTNIGLMVSVSKDGYGDLIDNVIKYYEGSNNYEKCSELIKLKEQL